MNPKPLGGALTPFTLICDQGEEDGLDSKDPSPASTTL